MVDWSYLIRAVKHFYTYGWQVHPGSDKDSTLLEVHVTGTPKLEWDETNDRFKLSKGLRINAATDQALGLDVYVSVAAGGVKQIHLGDATYGAFIQNGAGSGFQPAFIGQISGSTRMNMYIGRVLAAEDTGTTPVMALDSRRTSAAISTRPLLGIGSFAVYGIIVGPDAGLRLATEPATPAQNYAYRPSIIKAWVEFDGTAVATAAATTGVQAKYNVAGVLRSATGTFQINWDRDFATSAYAISGMADTGTVPASSSIVFVNTAAGAPLKTASSVTVVVRSDAGVNFNPYTCSVLAIGTQ